MSSKIMASIVISGDEMSFDACSKAVGLDPTTTFVRPYDYDSSLIAARQWCFATGKVELESIDDAVQALLSYLPSMHSIADFATLGNYDVELICSVDVYEDRPLYELSKESIASLSRLRARFSMEIHDLTED
jgi:hypothetical protein